MNSSPETKSSVEAKKETAESWAVSRFRLPLDRIKPDELKRFMRENEEAEKRAAAEGTFNQLLEAIEKKPELTPEEFADQDRFKKYGETNNLWMIFAARSVSEAEQELEAGELPCSGMTLQMLKPIFWQAKGALLPALEEVGYERVRRLYAAVNLAQKDRFNKDGIDWQQRLREELGDSLIDAMAKKSEVESGLEVENTLRRLALALRKRGISSNSIVS